MKGLTCNLTLSNFLGRTILLSSCYKRLKDTQHVDQHGDKSFAKLHLQDEPHRSWHAEPSPLRGQPQPPSRPSRGSCCSSRARISSWRPGWPGSGTCTSYVVICAFYIHYLTAKNLRLVTQALIGVGKLSLHKATWYTSFFPKLTLKVEDTYGCGQPVQAGSSLPQVHSGWHWPCDRLQSGCPEQQPWRDPPPRTSSACCLYK